MDAQDIGLLLGGSRLDTESISETEVGYPDTDYTESESESYDNYGVGSEPGTLYDHYSKLLLLYNEEPKSLVRDPIESDECCICLGVWDKRPLSYCGVCGTMFHDICISKCLQTSCPICRRTAEYLPIC